MILKIFLILFLLVIFYLLIMPIILFVDTASNKYYVQFKGLAKASFESQKEDIFRVKLTILFFKFYFYPLKNNNFFKTKKSKMRNSKKSNMSIKKGLRILRSFKVKKIFVNIDTGDCILNAKIYPFFSFLKHHTGNFNINFNGKNKLVLHIQNRPINIIKSFIN